MNARLPSTNLETQSSKWLEPHKSLDGLSMMDHLYNRLDGAYPHKWRSNFPNNQAISNWRLSWAEAFEMAGIKPADIKTGLTACQTKFDWPPSCAEFVKACKPQVDFVVAYYEAVNGVKARESGQVGEWSHPAIFWASSGLAFDLKNQAYSQIKDRWEAALKAQLEREWWDEIPAPLAALPAPGKTITNPEQAGKMIEKIEQAFKPKTDHKAWAKKIMERVRQGDKSVSLLQRNFAEEALSKSDV